MPKITELIRHKIIILHQQGHSQREISNQSIQAVIKCGIQAVIKKCEELGEVKDKRKDCNIFKSDEKSSNRRQYVREKHLIKH